MRISPRIISSAAAIALTCAVTAAAYFYRSRNAEVNEVMVFCRLQFNAYGCFDQLMSYVEAAKKSVSICMPGIHNVAIQGRLVKIMKERNIKVRIIVDQSGYDPSDFLLKELIDLGAEVKCYNDPPHHLQLKFCIVDDKVLLTGTLNWGSDRSSDHWNYVYITSKSQLVKPVKEKFNHMWSYWKEYPVGQDNETEGNGTAEHNDSDSEDQPSHTEDYLSHTEDQVRYREVHESQTQLETHTELENHTEELETHTEELETHTEEIETHTEEIETHTEDFEYHTEFPSTSQILSAVPDFTECVQTSKTFRQTVSTPEVYIS